MVRNDILGLPILWAYVPLGGYWEQRRVTRAERILFRQGVRRLLPLRDAMGWNLTLTVADSLPLYRAMADRLAVEVIRGKGIAASRATVALAGAWVDTDMARTAKLLCPRVRTLLLEVNHGSDWLARELYWEFGAAVGITGRADVCVRFSGAPRPDELVLCGKPDLLGLELELPGVRLPEQLDPATVLSVLWQAGRIDVGDLDFKDVKSAISQ